MTVRVAKSPEVELKVGFARVRRKHDGRPVNLIPQPTTRSGQTFQRLVDRLPAFRRPRRAGSASLGIPEGREATQVLRRDARYRRLLAVADLLSTALAVICAVEVFGGGDRLKATALVVVPLVTLISKTCGLYDRDEHVLSKTTLDEAPALFQLSTLGALVIWLGSPVFIDGRLGSDQVLMLWGLLFLSMLVGRALARRIARATTPPERCLVLGDADNAERICAKLDQSHAIPAIVVGRVPLEGHGEVEAAGRAHVTGGAYANGGAHANSSDRETLDLLGLVLVEQDIDRVIIAPGVSDSGEILDAVRLSRSLGIKVSVLPRLFEVVGSSIEFDDIDGTMLLGLRRDGLTRSSRLLKRSMDLMGSALGLVLLAPLMVGISLVIKLTSRGPVFFRQKRIGRRGTEFSMFKFRTMVDGADQQKDGLRALSEMEGLFKIADDPRLTPVGRFLRRSSFDELPQLLNVLRGEMSLVGPRPLVPDEDRQVRGWDRRRLQMTPGMTGAWQLFGPARIPLQEMVKIDYVYGANWSLWLDLKILLRTIPHSLGRRGL